MTDINIPNLGAKFLESVDEYLGENWKRLRCCDFYELYYSLFRSLKDYKGNSHGFTGVSEYLVFRCLYHSLGGSFKPIPIPSGHKCLVESKNVLIFENQTNNNIWIGSNIPIRVGTRRQNPDIVVFDSGELRYVVQIKIHLVKGFETAKDEIIKLDDLKQHNQEMNAIFLLFDQSPSEFNAINGVQNLLANKTWLRLIALKEKQKPFMEGTDQYSWSLES